VQDWKNWKIPILAGQLKTYSSRKMRKGHKYLFSTQLWGKKFWSGGYFHRTVGAVNAQTVKHYIKEGQTKTLARRRTEKTDNTVQLLSLSS